MNDINSEFNACMFREQCRKRATELETLGTEVDVLRADLTASEEANRRLRGTNAALGSRVIMHELKVACARVEELERQLSNEVATWNRFRMLINEVRACETRERVYGPNGWIVFVPTELWERLDLDAHHSDS